MNEPSSQPLVRLLSTEEQSGLTLKLWTDNFQGCSSRRLCQNCDERIIRITCSNTQEQNMYQVMRYPTWHPSSHHPPLSHYYCSNMTTCPMKPKICAKLFISAQQKPLLSHWLYIILSYPFHFPNVSCKVEDTLTNYNQQLIYSTARVAWQEQVIIIIRCGLSSWGKEFWVVMPSIIWTIEHSSTSSHMPQRTRENYSGIIPVTWIQGSLSIQNDGLNRMCPDQNNSCSLLAH